MAQVDVIPTGWPWSPDLIPLQTLISWLAGFPTPFPRALQPVPCTHACLRAPPANSSAVAPLLLQVGFIQPAFPNSCTSKYGGDSWKCLWGSYRMPLIETPYFANIVQLDDFMIQYDTDNMEPQTPAQLQFVSTIQNAYLNLIQQASPPAFPFNTCLCS